MESIRPGASLIHETRHLGEADIPKSVQQKRIEDIECLQDFYMNIFDHKMFLSLGHVA